MQLRALAALPTSDAQVVDHAVPPSTYSSPRLIRDTAAGLGVGLLLGLLLAFTLEAMDPPIKTSEEVQRLVPAPQLAGVPFAVFRRGLRLTRRRRPPRVLDAAKHHAEPFERLRTSLLVFNGESDLKTLLVTSPSDEKEGKTTVAANLAVSLAKIGLRVCVVDADLRHPRLGRHFGFGEADVGLVDVLGGAKLQTAISHFPLTDAPVLGGNGNGSGPHVHEIAVLPAGRPTTSPAELLASKQMQHVIDELESSYDVIVLDCAPLLAASDAMPLVSRACGTLLVVRLFHTPRKAAVRAVRVIERARGSLLGAVATGVSPRELREEGFGPWPAESTSSVAARVS